MPTETTSVHSAALSLYTRPVHDLGEASKNESLQGIFSPLYDDAEIKKYMSAHYESEAGVSSQTFDLTGYYKTHLTEALERASYSSRAGDVGIVLELGCGFGSVTLPLLELLPNAKVVATDLSLPMLVGLKKRLLGKPTWDRCVPMQLNAEQLDFKPHSLDMIVGAAVLHHLFTPETVLERCRELLKPGGIAIFFEPFENGMNVVSLIYQAILRHWRARLLDRRVREYMAYAVNYWQAMCRKPKTDPFFQGVDDKWFFTRTYLEIHARRIGFRECLVFPLSKSARPYEEMVKNHFSGNKQPDPKPWMMKIVNSVAETFSPEAKSDLMTEGGIILTTS